MKAESMPVLDFGSRALSGVVRGLLKRVHVWHAGLLFTGRQDVRRVLQNLCVCVYIYQGYVIYIYIYT